jgi:hypothetical protein
MMAAANRRASLLTGIAREQPAGAAGRADGTTGVGKHPAAPDRNRRETLRSWLTTPYRPLGDWSTLMAFRLSKSQLAAWERRIGTAVALEVPAVVPAKSSRRLIGEKGGG